MKKVIDETNYFFVDESGDPIFYDRQGRLIVGKEGISPILILGFIKTKDPKSIRSTLESLQLGSSKSLCQKRDQVLQIH